MRTFLRLVLCMALVAVPFGMLASGDGDSSQPHQYASIFVPRAAGADNLVLNLHRIGLQPLNECFYGHFRVGYEFEQSFHGKRIAEGFFGSSELLFQGSAVPNRDPKALLADNFGLGINTNAKLAFNPRIQNHVISFNLFVGLSELLEGLYFQIDAPLVHTKWDLRYSQPDKDKAVLSSTPAFLPGYMGIMFSKDTRTEADLKTYAPFSNFEDALNGKAFGNVDPQWQYGKFFSGSHDDTKLAALNFDLGYNFYECPDYHVGVYARVAAPTGTKLDNSHAEHLFAPTIGDDHWKLGAGVTVHAELYNCNDDHTVTAYFQGYVVHMFEKNQTRSFDFTKPGRLSRYMLLKKFEANNLAAGGMINAINFATRRAHIKVDVQGEAILEFVYKNCCGFSAGLGYNLYGKTREHIRLHDERLSVDNSKWGFKGATWYQVGGFKTYTPPPAQVFHIGAPEAAEVVHYLGATAGNATAYSAGTIDSPLPLSVDATGATDPTSGILYLQGIQAGFFPVDATPAPGAFVDQIAQESGVATPALGMNTAHSDINWTDTFGPTPSLITVADLDLDTGRAPHQLTNKVFGHVGYEWCDCDWTPFVRAGGEAEFASRSNELAMNAWGVFLTGGISF